MTDDQSYPPALLSVRLSNVARPVTVNERVRVRSAVKHTHTTSQIAIWCIRTRASTNQQ